MSNKVKTLATIGTAITAAKTATELYKQYIEYRNENRYYFIRIEDNMFVYPELMDFLNAEETDGKTFRLAVDRRHSRARRFYDSKQEASVFIGGYEFFVSVRKFDASGDDEDFYRDLTKPQRGLQFRTDSAAAVEALEDFIEELAKKKTLSTSPPNLMSPQTNYWSSNRLPRRDIDSIMLREGYKEDLTADLDRFFDSEERYLKIGVPWHRGYLLYGPPGNGKSSIVMSLANAYGKNLYALSPNSIKDDNALNNLLREVEEDSILLIEDIDVFASSVSRDKDSDKGPTLAGMLNALDGVYTPHGLVTFITTNRIEALDDALIRPGRVDYRLHLEAPTDEQIERSFLHIYGEPLNVAPRKFGSMAEFIGIIKRHQDDAMLGRTEIADLDTEHIANIGIKTRGY